MNKKRSSIFSSRRAIFSTSDKITVDSRFYQIFTTMKRSTIEFGTEIRLAQLTCEGAPIYKSYGECGICHAQMMMDQPKCMIAESPGYVCEHCQKHTRGQCTSHDCPDEKGLYVGWEVLFDVDLNMIRCTPPKSWLEHELRYQEALHGYTQEKIKRIKLQLE